LVTEDQIQADLDSQLILGGWENGDLFWKLQDHQIDIYQFLRSRTGLTCVALLSRRYGKTHVCYIADVEDCIRTPGSRIAYFYPTLKQGKQIIFPIADTVFEDAPKEQTGTWSEQESCYEFQNGSKIYILGCDTMRDIDRLRGAKYSSIRIDESGVHHYLKYLYKSVLLPTLLTMQVKPLITFMGTPSLSIDHEFRTIYESNNLKGDAIRKTILDNTAIPEDTRDQFIEESGGYNSTETKREYFCEWVTDSEYAVIPEWRDHFIEEKDHTEFYKFYPIVCSMDIGGRDKTAIVWGYYDSKRGQLIVEHEAILTGQETTPAKIADAIKEVESLYYEGKTIRRWADNNAVILLQDLAINHNINFNPTSKDLKLAMVADCRTMVGAGRVVLHPRVIELAGCLRSAIWDSTKTTFQRSSIFGHFDALDALIYLVRNLDDNSNPIPSLYNVDVANTFGYDRLIERKSIDNLKNAFRRK
jgi:hypothetical protein